MKFSALAISMLLASMTVMSVSAHAQDSQSQRDALMQDFNDSQFCAVLLLKLGGEKNQKKSARALAHAKEIAPQAGFGDDEAFKKSYAEWTPILELVDKNEMTQFTKFCTEKW